MDQVGAVASSSAIVACDSRRALSRPNFAQLGRFLLHKNGCGEVGVKSPCTARSFGDRVTPTEKAITPFSPPTLNFWPSVFGSDS